LNVDSLTLPLIRRAVSYLDKYRQPADAPCFVVAHPDTVQELRYLEFRWQWKLSYRAWRCVGKPEMSLRQIWDKYHVPSVFTGELSGFSGLTVAE
jgi:hypothetical protein